MSQDMAVPEGYLKDHKGRLIPINMVDDLDKAKSELVKEVVKKAKVVQAQMKAFKAEAMGDVLALVDLVNEKYGAKLGGKKGNICLSSYDGQYQVKIAVAEHMVFGPELDAAKSLIDECIHEWMEGSNEAIKVIVNDAFQTDKQGKVSTSRILGLRKHKIDDTRWGEAMDAIADSISIIDTKPYLRMYERNSAGKYQPIPLDIAAL